MPWKYKSFKPNPELDAEYSCPKSVTHYFTLTHASCPVSRNPWMMIFVGLSPLNPESSTYNNQPDVHFPDLKFTLVHRLGVLKVKARCHQLIPCGK